MIEWLDLRSDQKRYLTDLPDEEWLIIQPFLWTVSKPGRKPMADLRDVLDVLRLPWPDGWWLTDAAARLPALVRGRKD